MNASAAAHSERQRQDAGERCGSLVPGSRTRCAPTCGHPRSGEAHTRGRNDRAHRPRSAPPSPLAACWRGRPRPRIEAKTRAPEEALASAGAVHQEVTTTRTPNPLRRYAHPFDFAASPSPSSRSSRQRSGLRVPDYAARRQCNPLTSASHIVQWSARGFASRIRRSVSATDFPSVVISSSLGWCHGNKMVLPRPNIGQRQSTSKNIRPPGMHCLTRVFRPLGHIGQRGDRTANPRTPVRIRSWPPICP